MDIEELGRAKAQMQAALDQQPGWSSGSQGCGTAQGGGLGNYQVGQQHVCPACGYCPCCGRKNAVPVPSYPQWPGYPSPYDPIPFWPPYTPTYTCGTQVCNGPQVQSYN
jgi:hypothetical protein